MSEDNKNISFKTLVFGASLKPERYSHSAVTLLDDRGYKVAAIGGRSGQVGDVEILTGHPDITDVHTITMYMGSERAEEHEDYLLSLNPQRIIFNPGAENYRLAEKAIAQGIEVIDACTLVMIRTGQYDPSEDIIG